MAKIKELKVDKQQKKLFQDEIQDTIEFLYAHYNIRKPIHDPSKINITCKDESKYTLPPTTDNIWMHLRAEGKNVSENLLRKIIRNDNCIAPYNPITEYFDSIRGSYKGESHIELLCRHLQPRTFDEHPPEYYTERTLKLVRKWMVACVACWLGNKPNDVSLGFISDKEGMGKSHLTQFFVPQCLEDYGVLAGNDSPGDTHRFDIQDAFTRYMIVIFDELNGIRNKASILPFKSMMSKPKINYKRRYEEFATDKTRIACAMFSTNRNEEIGGFLTLDHGYRRWGCIEIDNIDRRYSEVVDVDQMWSEALNLYEDTDFNSEWGETDYMEFAEYNHRYRLEIPAMRYIERFLSFPDDENEGERLATTQIYERIRNKIRSEDLKHVGKREIGMALNALGFDRQSIYDKNKRYSVYLYHVVINE